MAYNFDNETAKAVKTVLQGLTASVDLVQIVPAGAEKDVPDEAKSAWINVSVKNNDLAYETSNSYVGTSKITVTVGVRSNCLLEEVAEKSTAVATEVLAMLLKSTLGGYARRSPSDFASEGYSGGGDANAVYWYAATFDFEKQVNP